MITISDFLMATLDQVITAPTGCKTYKNIILNLSYQYVILEQVVELSHIMTRIGLLM